MTLPSRLVDGYLAFTRGRLPVEHDRYQDLAAAGQQPEIMVLG